MKRKSLFTSKTCSDGYNQNYGENTLTAFLTGRWAIASIRTFSHLMAILYLSNATRSSEMLKSKPLKMLEKRNIDCMDSEWLSRAEWTQRIWRKLDEHLPVHIFGKWGNFTCPAPPDENFSTEEGAKGLWKYKFFLTFESSLFEDYITEKNWGFGLQNGLGLLSLAVQTTKKTRNSRIFHRCSKVSNCRTMSKVYWVLRQQWHGVRCLFLSGRNTTDSKSRVLCSTAHSAKLYIVQSEIREKSMTILTNIGTKTNAMVRLRCLE